MVRKGFVLLLGVILACALYSLLGNLNPNLIVLINAFAVLVFFTALVYGEIEGAVMGTVAGLLQDTFSHQVFGLGGLSLTIAGFLLALVAQKLNLNNFFKRGILVFFFSLVQLIIWTIFYSLIFKKSWLYSKLEFYLQPIFTAIITTSLVTLFPKLKKYRS